MGAKLVRSRCLIGHSCTSKGPWHFASSQGGLLGVDAEFPKSQRGGLQLTVMQCHFLTKSRYTRNGPCRP